MPILTLGHSTHEPQRFIEICTAARIQVILDIRSHPTSRWPWWHRPEMETWLPEAGIRYEWIGGLGGWDMRHSDRLEWAAERGVDLDPYLRGYFPKQRIGAKKPADQPELGQDPDLVSGWTSQGLHDYAWYTTLPEFREAAQDVVARYGEPTQPRAALVCSEFLWWKCHRSLVADYLTYRNIPTWHAMPGGDKVKAERHSLVGRLQRYPRAVITAWNQNGGK